MLTVFALSDSSASPLPLVLVGLLVTVFLCIEARRYRFFDFWRVRAHILETQFFGPILLGHGVQTENHWNQVLYEDGGYVDGGGNTFMGTCNRKSDC